MAGRSGAPGDADGAEQVLRGGRRRLRQCRDRNARTRRRRAANTRDPGQKGHPDLLRRQPERYAACLGRIQDRIDTPQCSGRILPRFLRHQCKRILGRAAPCGCHAAAGQAMKSSLRARRTGPGWVKVAVGRAAAQMLSFPGSASRSHPFADATALPGTGPERIFSARLHIQDQRVLSRRYFMHFAPRPLRRALVFLI